MGNDKKDLTGILDLQRLQAEDPSAVAENTEQDPFALNELQTIEQVDAFESIDQIGMIDHPVEESIPTDEPAFQDPSTTFETTTSAEPVLFSEQPSIATDDPFAVTEHPEVASSVIDDPFAVSVQPEVTSPVIDEPFVVSAQPAVQPAVDATPEPFPEIQAAPPSKPSAPSLDSVKNYSEKTSGITGTYSRIFYPFHLRIHGTFGPFERDKLLLFISENPIGLSSSDLDLQIQSGKVLLPRISEFSAVKLIQELRDSGLSFQTHPSDQDEAVILREPAQSYHYQNPSIANASTMANEIPILNANTKPTTPYHELEEVSVVQFVRTDLIEVENSPIIQEVIERMTEALKQKARIKGGNALMHLQKEITPLRLPSQYQISLKANVIRLP